MIDQKILDNNLNDQVSYPEFFRAFGYDDRDEINLRFFYDPEKGKKAGKEKAITQFFDKVLSRLNRYNSADCGIYFVVNSGGQTAKEIRRCMAFFIEIDDGTFEEQLEKIKAFPLEPSIIIRTKKSLHTYWIIDGGLLDRRLWKSIQYKLINHFGSDEEIADPSRVMRLYGFYHCKDPENKTLVKLLKFSPELKYSVSQFEELELPELTAGQKKNVGHTPKTFEEAQTTAKAKTDRKTGPVSPVVSGGEKIGAGYRHNYMKAEIGKLVNAMKECDRDAIVFAAYAVYQKNCVVLSDETFEDFENEYGRMIDGFLSKQDEGEEDPDHYAKARQAFLILHPEIDEKDFKPSPGWTEEEAALLQYEADGKRIEEGWKEYQSQRKPESGHVIGFDDEIGDPEGTSADEPKILQAKEVPKIKRVWQEPIPFGQVGKVPFPVDAFPKKVRAFIEAVAESIQVPVEMVGCEVLGAMAACLQGKYYIHIKSGWNEPLNLYILAVGEPAERKSAAISQIFKPILDYQKYWNAENAEKIAENRDRKRVLNKKVTRLEKLVVDGKASAEQEQEYKEKLKELHTFKDMSEMDILSDDATQAALTRRMSKHDGIATIYSAEGNVFNMMSGIYSNKVSDLTIYLKAHSGDYISIDRVKDNTHFSIPHPHLTMVIAAQPIILSRAVQNQEFRETGLCARFLYTIPVSKVGNRPFNTKQITNRVELNFSNLIQNFLDDRFNPSVKNAEEISLSPEAYKLFAGLYEEVEKKLNTEYEGFQDWAGKYCGAVGRIAGILCRAEKKGCHMKLCEENPLEVSEETMMAAIRLGEYFVEQARATFEVTGYDPVVKQCKYLLKRIAEKQWLTIDRRQIQNKCRTIGLDAVEKVQRVLDKLEEYGYIRGMDNEREKRVGAPHSRTYEVHPAVFGENE